MEKIKLQDVVAESPNRRRFVRTLGLAGVAATAAAQLSGQSTQGITDVDILNFALNLEYLEAEFYSIATLGKRIEQLGIGVDGTEGMEGPTTGGRVVHFVETPNYCKELANEVGEDERAHVTLIRTALKAAGAPYIAKPAINLNALGFGFSSERDFFVLARIFEDIGVSAYGGAAPLITSKEILGTAARILAAEAEHVAAIRLQVARLVAPTSPLDGVDITPPPSGKKLVSLDNNGLSAIRTPGQVLYLAYGGANKMSGGFFPQGVNGVINMSTDHA
jgi:hypothetical protein